MREEKELVRVKNKSARENMKREIEQSGRKKVIQVLRGKKEKEGEKWEKSEKKSGVFVKVCR